MARRSVASLATDGSCLIKRFPNRFSAAIGSTGRRGSRASGSNRPSDVRGGIRATGPPLVWPKPKRSASPDAPSPRSGTAPCPRSDRDLGGRADASGSGTEVGSREANSVKHTPGDLSTSSSNGPDEGSGRMDLFQRATVETNSADRPIEWAWYDFVIAGGTESASCRHIRRPAACGTACQIRAEGRAGSDPGLESPQ